MNAPTRAVIDVGTNTIKLMVARAGFARVEPILECNARPSIRLGAGFYRHQKLRADAMHAAALAVRELSTRCARCEPVSVRAIATSAVRDARNSDEFIALIQETAGLSLEVLSGKTEAEWIFRGVTSDPSNCREKLLVFGLGGGSTAAIVSDLGRTHCCSFNLGAVRLMEMLRVGSSPTPHDWDRCEIYLSLLFNELIVPQLNSVLSSKLADFTLVLTGGIASALAKMRMHAQNVSWADDQTRWFTRDEVSKTAERLWALDYEERKAIPGLSEARCDVILPGLAILEAAMKHLGFARIKVSLRGVRYGALLDASESCEVPQGLNSFLHTGHGHRTAAQFAPAAS